MAQVTVDLDLVDLALGLLAIGVNAAMLVHFRRHQPDKPLLRLACVIGILGGSFLAFGKFFYRLALAG